MLAKIVPKEKKRFDEKFNEIIETKRIELKKLQVIDCTKLEEKIKSLGWNEIRRKDKEMSIAKQRISNHSRDMAHAHLLEEKLRAEMSVKPSALWLKRQVFYVFKIFDLEKKIICRFLGLSRDQCISKGTTIS